MIVSRRHGFVFIKTRKTAGTSLEIALSDVCGPDDIVTSILEDAEGIRRVAAQNVRIPLSRAAAVDGLGRIVRFRRPTLTFTNHVPMHVVRRHLDLDGLFSFTVERNPWDRAISLYFWSTRDVQGSRPTVSTFLREVGWHISNFPTYSHEGKVIVDRVLRYENLAADLDQVWRDLELPGVPVLPRAKSGFRQPLQLDADDIAFISDRCRREIELLGYEPPPELVRPG